ncbi:serine protease [Pelomonas sp. Root1444]|uniref:trypsin-like serine peptidase n=1 Tax=Pelomonas sp. Root1444 TaxID=1736464 RepID=UPI000702A2B5|nr:hypothetical protein [Pelomonas sp. Root1444]KQY80905.1 hypothetical protein ASD35_03400 [Pelomonas sp. Root1444]
MDQPSEAPLSEPQIEIPSLKSLFIEAYFDDQLLGSTTGFLLTRSMDTPCVLLTNRHVVTGRHQVTGKPLDKKHGAVPNAIVIHFHKEGTALREWKQIRLPLYRNTSEPYWIEHPRLGADADVVALNLSWGSDVARIPYYLDGDLDRKQMVLSPAEPVSVIGFPFGLASHARFPIWATGFLAQDLTFMSPERPKFFIDCRSRQGQSGSPVIAFRVQGARTMREGRPVASLDPNPTWEFLGIYSGRVNEESDIGIVWHVSVLGELFDAAIADNAARQAAAATAAGQPDVPQGQQAERAST